MILQPVVENAYTHGLSRLDSDGLIAIKARRENSMLQISVVNSGLGFHPKSASCESRQGVGLANIRNRLRLHYGNDQDFTIEELARGEVRVTLSLPLQFSERPAMKLAGYGV
jgi:sensor histidine kinase YesM